MILAAWEAEAKIQSPVLRLCSQGAGDREASCSILNSHEISHRKNGELASWLLIPESLSPGNSYFQVESAGKVYDSPYFSVAESIRKLDAMSSPGPPATGTRQGTTPLIELVTQTIVATVSSSSHQIELPSLPAIPISLESLSWLPSLPAKPPVRLDSHDLNVVGPVMVIMAVLLALAAIGALVAVLHSRCTRNRRLDVTAPCHRGTKADDRPTRSPEKKKLDGAPRVQYLPNLHSLGIHTVPEGLHSNGTSSRMLFEDVRLTPRIPFPSPRA